MKKLLSVSIFILVISLNTVSFAYYSEIFTYPNGDVGIVGYLPEGGTQIYILDAETSDLTGVYLTKNAVPMFYIYYKITYITNEYIMMDQYYSEFGLTWKYTKTIQIPY
jgi:hypothetical protein